MRCMVDKLWGLLPFLRFFSVMAAMRGSMKYIMTSLHRDGLIKVNNIKYFTQICNFINKKFD